MFAFCILFYKRSYFFPLCLSFCRQLRDKRDKNKGKEKTSIVQHCRTFENEFKLSSFTFKYTLHSHRKEQRRSHCDNDVVAFFVLLSVFFRPFTAFHFSIYLLSKAAFICFYFGFSLYFF